MRAIMVMYDSLNRALLEPYGCDWTKTPNFQRLAQRSVTFDNCYVGSMPCMPARRELHTGRMNFLHRSWGPVEPYDDSMPEILKNSGVYTHLVSDHQHYWEDGGATYHTRYNSWDCVRGQEGDPWKAVLPVQKHGKTAFADDTSHPLGLRMKHHDAVNRRFMQTEAQMPQARTFAGGLEFLELNHGEDNWFLQIETFDPHEPFYSLDAYKALYPHEYSGPPADWPPYYPVQEDAGTVQHVRYEYAALLSMCDAYLGRVLDFMDAHDMWKDTLLIVNTDHGYLLGEHGWWSKTVMPTYNEIAHTPLFVWDPRLGVRGERREALVQTIDLAPTLLEFFGRPIPQHMEGKPLRGVIEADTPLREYAVFGYHGGHINITDGRWLYMRAPVRRDGQPLYDYTLMPTHMRSLFSTQELQGWQRHPGFSFTKGCAVMQVPAGLGQGNPFPFGNKLFDLQSDPGQLHEIQNDALELRLLEALRQYMLAAEAPPEQYERLGIPAHRPPTREDLAATAAARAAELSLGILPELEVTPEAANQLLCLAGLPVGGGGMLEQFEVFARAQEGLERVDTALVEAFLQAQFEGDTLQMLGYILALQGRTH